MLELGLIHRRKGKEVKVLLAKRGSQFSRDSEMALLWVPTLVLDFLYDSSLTSKLLGSHVLQPGIGSDSIFERVAGMERKSYFI